MMQATFQLFHQAKVHMEIQITNLELMPVEITHTVVEYTQLTQMQTVFLVMTLQTDRR